MSSDIHVPSSVVNSTLLVDFSGRPLGPCWSLSVASSLSWAATGATQSAIAQASAAIFKSFFHVLRGRVLGWQAGSKTAQVGGEARGLYSCWIRQSQSECYLHP